jgi:hypothetical protein
MAYLLKVLIFPPSSQNELCEVRIFLKMRVGCPSKTWRQCPAKGQRLLKIKMLQDTSQNASCCPKLLNTERTNPKSYLQELWCHAWLPQNPPLLVSPGKQSSQNTILEASLCGPRENLDLL